MMMSIGVLFRNAPEEEKNGRNWNTIGFLRNDEAEHKFKAGENSSGRAYHYLVSEEQAKQAKVGNYAVVFSPVSGPVVTEIVSAPMSAHPRAGKYVMAIVDLAEYQKKVAQLQDLAIVEAGLANLLERSKTLKRYEELAEVDPEAKALLARFKALTGRSTPDAPAAPTTTAA